MRNDIALAISVALLSFPVISKAEEAGSGSAAVPPIIEARPDALIKQFVYDQNTVYEIRSRAGMFTNIEVPKGEKILGFYLSDTTFWKYVVSQDGARVLVRPSEPGRYNSGTMVTDKRVYELAFRSFSTNEPHWFQRVQWAAEPDTFIGWGVFADPPVAARQQDNESAKPAAGAAADELPSDWTINMQRANTDYRITQSDSFAPTLVLDDGVFTYMRFPALRDMPAIFAFDRSPSEARIVDYVVRGNNVLVHRVAEGGFVLKLGARTVVIERAEKAGR